MVKVLAISTGPTSTSLLSSQPLACAVPVGNGISRGCESGGWDDQQWSSVLSFKKGLPKNNPEPGINTSGSIFIIYLCAHVHIEAERGHQIWSYKLPKGSAENRVLMHWESSKYSYQLSHLKRPRIHFSKYGIWSWQDGSAGEDARH